MVEAEKFSAFGQPRKEYKKGRERMKFPTAKEAKQVRFFRAGIFFDLPPVANLITISNVAPEAESSIQAHLERQAQKKINELERKRKKSNEFKGQMRFNAEDILSEVGLSEVKGLPINVGKSNLPPIPKNAKLYLIEDKSSQGGLKWYYGEENSKGITKLREFNLSGVKFFSPFRPPVKNKKGKTIKPAGDLHHLIEKLENEQEEAEQKLERMKAIKSTKKRKK